MIQPSDSLKPAGQWLKNNLVTLGSAAVFTVYSAGYFRTREAADRFAGESVQRRAAVAAPPVTNAHTVEARDEAAAHSASSLPVMRPSSVAAAGAPKSNSTASNSAPASSTAPASPAAPAAPGTPAAPSTISAPAGAADGPPSAPAPAAPAVDSAAAAAAKKEENNQLKDGTFYGWGTSRHGDIQASVEIKNGKITGAYISQCLTRYSCSWISMLPPQVIQRQTAEVDYVSGATQSSNAFYYAIVEALKQAK
jgi:uncharacterized protein with FMN-binding domain